MICREPGCDLETSVTETRDKLIDETPSVRRRRECAKGHRFTTYEMTRDDLTRAQMLTTRFEVIRRLLLDLAREVAEPPPVDFDLTQPAPLGSD